MKNATADLITTINTYDPIVRVAGLKAVAHSCMAQAFHGIQQQLTMPDRKKQEELDDNDVEGQTLDKRAELENEERPQTVHSSTDPWEDIATRVENAVEMYYAIVEELTTPESSKWDVPMEPEQMMDFMIKNAQPISPVILELLAQASGIAAEDLKTFAEIQERDNQQRLMKYRDGILKEFESLKPASPNVNVEQKMGHVAKHQLGIKALIGIQRTLERRTTQILRSRRLTNISDTTVLKNGCDAMTLWLHTAEEEYNSELTEAMEQGRSITLVEEV